MADVDVKITIDETARQDITRIEKALTDEGLRVKATIPEFRTIFGRIDDGGVERLRGVTGVELIKPEGKFTLPPMSEKVPQ